MAPATAAPQQAPAQPEIANFEPPVGMECKRIKTTAEKVFDASAYTGIGWFGNAALSTSIAYYLKHSESGKPKFTKMVKTVAEFFNKERPNPALISKNAEFLSLVIGGTMLMVPLKIMEDHKAKVVRGMDKVITGLKMMVGFNETKEQHDQKEAAFELLESEPKQNWATILRARFVGLGVAILTLNLVGTKTNNAIENATAKTATNVLKNNSATKHLNSETVYNVAKLGTLDVIYSFVAAAGLYVDSHFINPPKNNKKIQHGTLSPINPPNEETSWVGHVKKHEMPAPAGSFVEAHALKEGDQATVQR